MPRPIEAIVAAGGLAAGLPVLAASGALIKLTSPGPILFRQTRVGRGGRPFTLFKLRTMRSGASGASVTAGDDHRITRVGKLLRDTKLDELPTLWNVVRGDMSLVGPRPEVPTYVDRDDALWSAVLRARPGLTSPMAITLRNEEEVMAEVDNNRDHFYRETLLPYKLISHAQYIESRSWRSDVRVILRTLTAIVRPPRSPTREEIEHVVQMHRGAGHEC